MALLEVCDVSFTYSQAKEPALKNISFSVEKGEFIAVCGSTGSGKSTLLRLLKRELAPLGAKTGEIFLNNVSQEQLNDQEAAYTVGYVMQRPEQQLVTDKVWHELAFGLENMHLPQPVIARRIAEMASYFGIEEWFEKDIASLSGGQKQLLNLAAVMVMKPSLLILDEPTAQLDPIAASDFIATVRKLNQELGITVIMTEHRLEEVIPVCDRVLIIKNGAVLALDSPAAIAEKIAGQEELLSLMPAAVRIFHALKPACTCPLNVREGRKMIEENYSNHIKRIDETTVPSASSALSFHQVSFRYDKHGPDILRNLNFTVNEGEIYCILGGNGAGKTTTLLSAAGLLSPYTGQIRVFEKKIKEYKNQSLYRECLTMLPQDVQTLFLCDSVREELKGIDLSVLPFDLSRLFSLHPYDLSGGEQQLVGLAKVLSTNPRLLLLDEPTKGIDAVSKNTLIQIFRELKKRGMTLVIVTHDVEFAAQCADRCALFFRGAMISSGTPREFFCENSFYTTAVSRMTSGHFDNAVTVEDAVFLCRANERKSAVL